MKYAVIYQSKSGNTRLIAEQIYFWIKSRWYPIDFGEFGLRLLSETMGPFLFAVFIGPYFIWLSGFLYSYLL